MKKTNGLAALSAVTAPVNNISSDVTTYIKIPLFGRTQLLRCNNSALLIRPNLFCLAASEREATNLKKIEEAYETVKMEIR